MWISPSLRVADLSLLNKTHRRNDFTAKRVSVASSCHRFCMVITKRRSLVCGWESSLCSTQSCLPQIQWFSSGMPPTKLDRVDSRNMDDALMNSHFFTFVEKEAEWTNQTWKVDPHTAAMTGDVDVVRIIGRANVNAINMAGWTPLLYASATGRVEVVQTLLKIGANVDACSSYGGLSALMLVTRQGCTDGVVALLKAGAKIDQQDSAGWTALSWAAGRGLEMITRILLEAGASFEKRDKEGRTPILHAVENGHESIVSILISKGASLAVRSNKGLSARDLAAVNNHTYILSLIDQYLGSSEPPRQGGPSPGMTGETFWSPQNQGKNIQTATPRTHTYPQNQEQSRESAARTAGGTCSVYPLLVSKIPSSLEELLDNLKQTKHLDAFRRRNIDLDALMELSPEDLKTIIVPMGPRKLIQLAVDEIRASRQHLDATGVSFPLPDQEGTPMVRLESVTQQREEALKLVPGCMAELSQAQQSIGQALTQLSEGMRSVSRVTTRTHSFLGDQVLDLDISLENIYQALKSTQSNISELMQSLVLVESAAKLRSVNNPVPSTSRQPPRRS